MIIYLLLLIFVAAVLFSWFSLIKDAKSSNIPGPFPMPLVGNGNLFLGPATQYLNQLEKVRTEFGDVVRLYALFTRTVVIYHPKYVEPIITSSELITKGKAYDFLHSWLGQGLLTSTGDRWRTHRRFLTPAFHFNILQNFLPVFCKNEEILIQNLKKLADGSPVDLFSIIALNALDNVTESIMGVSVNAQNNSESDYVQAINKLSTVIAARIRNPFIEKETIFNLTSGKKIQDKALKILHGQTNKVINARKQELQKADIKTFGDKTETGVKNRQAFLDLLLLTTDSNGRNIDDVAIREEVDTFMFEGHDTTTSGIVFCLYCIAKYSKVQEKILEEQKSIFGNDFERDPTYVELKQMKYLENVIKESLRIYPSVPLIQRLITRDIDVHGYKFLQDTTVIIDIFHMQRNPGVFEDPLEFKPERFDSKFLNNNAFSWLAFSAGPRNCIGQKFAMMEMKVTLSSLVRHFKILPSDLEPQLCADLILRSENDVQVKFLPRL